MNDLFGEGGTFKGRAYKAAPGSGPEGKQCRDCKHMHRQPGGSRTFSKCGLMPKTVSQGGDISMYAAACSYFKEDRG